MKLLHALMFAVALAGCSSGRPERSEQPAPRVTETVTVSPTPTDTPTADVTHYRMMTVVQGHADVTFVVTLNGNTVGTLNGDTNGDLTPSVLPGDNAVVVSWTQAHPLKPEDKATLSIERQIPGQDGWTTVFSRVVDPTTKIKEAKGTFANEAMGDNSGTNGTMHGASAAENSPTDSAGNYTTSPTGTNRSSGSNQTTGANTSTPSNLTSPTNTTKSGTNSTSPANLTQTPRPLATPSPRP